MALRRTLLLAGALACGLLANLVVAPLSGQTGPASAPPPAAQPAQSDKDLEVRYAQAYVKLMEATLAKYQEMNRRTPNTIRPAVIQAVQEAVDKARQRLEVAGSQMPAESRLYVMRAETDLRLSEEAMRQADELNRRRPGTVSSGEVERLRAEIDLARLRVERARRVAAASPAANIRFELDQMREDIEQLRLLVALLRAGRV